MGAGLPAMDTTRCNCHTAVPMGSRKTVPRITPYTTPNATLTSSITGTLIRKTAPHLVFAQLCQHVFRGYEVGIVIQQALGLYGVVS